MSLFTKFLNLFKYDPVNDKVKTFNITKALNENWDKIDTKVEEISNNKVDKVEGKGLSTSDYTLEEKIKLGGISKQATKVETSVINGSIKIDGVNAKVYDDSEISNRVGPLANLLTTIKTSIVNAINSLKTEVDEHKADNALHLIQNGGILNGSSVNFNTLTPNRIYLIQNTTGSTGTPTENYGTLLALNPLTTGYRTQIFFANVSNKMFMRSTTNFGAEWSAWTQL